MEERIYQRQMNKLSLSESIVDEKETVDQFTRDEVYLSILSVQMLIEYSLSG